jgi:hypothetical protein
MTKQLVFVHGRAQEHKDAAALKEEWVQAWRAGLAESGLTVPVDGCDIRFPYYGQALFDLVGGASGDAVAEIVVRGLNDPVSRQFLESVLSEVLKESGVSDAQVLEDVAVLEHGPLNVSSVQTLLRAIDRHIPGASGLSLALATNDVYQYLSNPGLRDKIESGVRQALMAGASCVVGHSLGTVVSYNLLRREGVAMGWHIPLFVTLGSPLAVTAIKRKLRPLQAIPCVEHWFNARDTRDVVALYPLDAVNFNIDPAIENKADVRNETQNRHGIAGYLRDAEVARRIHDAVLD